MGVQHKDLTGEELHQPMPIGTDAGKPASPSVGDWYLAVDTAKLYVCLTAGVWQEFGSDPSTIQDGDGDTKVETEQGPDEDKVRVTTAGTQRAVVDADGLKLEEGASVKKFSTDGTLAGNSDTAVPTEKAVKTYCGNLDTSPADGSISTAKLKTSTGDVSSSSTSVLNMPGGTYGFYPQTRSSTGSSTAGRITMGGTSLNGNGQINSSFGTWIAFIPNGCTLYASQRYITSSGKDYWAFILVEKATGEIAATYCAPDHPCYGNGGDPELVPHPFGDFDEDKYAVVLLDKASAEMIRDAQSPSAELREKYKIFADGVYEPLHTGQFLDKDPQLIETLPENIQVKTIKKLTTAERNARAVLMDERRQQAEQEEAYRVKIEEQKALMAIEALKQKGELPEDYGIARQG